MAKKDKDRLYYEITREKAYGSFQMLMVGGSAGSVLGFLIASLVGAYEGMEMDSLVLAFLVASLLGFFFGLLLMWLAITYLEKLIPSSTLIGGLPAATPPVETASMPEEAQSVSALEPEEGKGKSIDFVFPELTPDNQS
jgi:MFS family permease